MAAPDSLFPSFFGGGFECSSHRRKDGRRLDLVTATRHDLLAVEDYAALASHGLSVARDGVRWHLVEAIPGRYDWSSVLPQIKAAQRTGVRVIWDLAHYGYPDHLDPWSAVFDDALAAFAAEFARLVAAETGSPPLLCPVNEVSFWSWAGGEVGYFNPTARGRGAELKRRLVSASLRAARAARAAVPGTRVIAVDPLIHVVERTPAQRRIAARHTASQWEGWDALLGRQWPELGGGPDGFDAMGVNFYWNNQWEHEGEKLPVGHPRHRPFRELLLAAWQRYQLPIFVAETSIEGSLRAPWLRYVGEEVRSAMRLGVPVQAVFLYPVLSHPGWDDNRYCPNGLLELEPSHGRRPVHEPLAVELRRQQASFAALLRGEIVPEDDGAAEAFMMAMQREHGGIAATAAY